MKASLGKSLVVLGLVVTGLLGAIAVVDTPASAASSRRQWKRATTTTVKPTVKPTTTTSAAPRVTTTTTAPRATTTTTTAAQPATTTTAKPPSEVGSTVLFGASTEESSFTSFNNLHALEQRAGKQVSMYVIYKSFYWDPSFPTEQANAIAAQGMTPFLTWEPFNPSAGVNQPDYQLADIAGGAYDALVDRWAREIKAWGKPMFLRFAAEMNGTWFPWSIGYNGNTAADYVNAWRHVHGRFAAAGVTNVAWVWNPNVIGGSTVALSSVYPGDAYVDWVGIDGYNWGTSQSWSAWQSPASVFGPTLSEVRGITRRPIMIGETSSAEAGGDKAAWITQFFGYLKANSDIKAFVWFNFNKETDWRIESSPAAQSAFAQGIADPRYV